MNIIAVDDNEFALSSLSRAIAGALPDCRIHSFLDADEALKFAAGERTDIAFLDIMLGEISGLELAKRLKEVHADVKIVFVTGYSEYAVDAFKLHAGGYLLKPVDTKAVQEAVRHLQIPETPVEHKLRVQTFGNFEVFAGRYPIRFSRSKAKELFAYLVHKRGTGCNLREIAERLFVDRDGDAQPLLKQTQNVITAMLQALKSVGFESAVFKTHNNLAVDVTKIDCDYYRFLAGESAAVNAYMGEYMANYDWAEFMLGYLDGKRK